MQLYNTDKRDKAETNLKEIKVLINYRVRIESSVK